MNAIAAFDNIVKNYTAEDAPLVRKTIDVLCNKGIANGAFQDYGVLADIIAVLGCFERAVKERGQAND